MGIRKLVKYLIVKNLLYEIGLKDIIIETKRTPKTNNPIEAYVNQIKTYMKKNRNVDNYEQLEKNVENAIEKVKPENYKNYFQDAYGMNGKIEFIRKPSTRKRKLKIYK